VTDAVYTTPSALATIRANAETEKYRQGWKSAAFWPYGDADMIIALVDALEEAKEKIEQLQNEWDPSR
jgi:hypothetical protein